MIIQHRRGTTQEWNELDAILIPEEGELVIEECADHSIKCKIGTGTKRFSKLPYIDDEVKEILRAEIAEKAVSFKKELSELRDQLSNSFSSDLSNVENSLTQTIDSKYHELISSVEKTHIADMEQLENQLSNHVSTLRGEAAGLAKLLTELANVQHEELVTELKRDANEIAENLAVQIDEQSEVFDTKLQKSANELKADYEKQIDSAKQSIQTQIKASGYAKNDDLQSLRNFTNDNINSITEQLKAFNDVYNELEQLEIALSTETDIRESSLSELRSDISSQVSALISMYSTGLKAVRDDFDTKITSTADNLRNELEDKAYLLGTSIEMLSQNTGAQLTALSDTLNKLEADSENLDTELSLQVQLLKLKTEALTKELDNLEKKVDVDTEREIQDILASLYGLRSSLGTLQTDLNKRISDTETTFTNTLTSKIASVNANLTSDIIDLQLNFNKLNADVRNKMSETSVITAELRNTIENNNIATNNYLDSMSDRVEEANELIADTNDEIKVQSSRLDNLITYFEDEASVKSEDQKFTELVDIRTGYDGTRYESAGKAVRAIGSALADLEERLPSFIPENSVDNLYYDGNQLYLMSDGEQVGDAITITGGGGGGGGSFSSVKLESDKRNFTVAKGNPAKITFTFTSLENGSINPTDEGDYTIAINNKIVSTLSGKIGSGATKTVDVTEHLKDGTNNIVVTCYNSANASRSLKFTISIVELLIDSKFNYSETFNDEFLFRVNVTGQIAKVVHVAIDGEEVVEPAPLNARFEGDISFTIPKQVHGCHTLTSWLTAEIEDDEVRSNELSYEIICVEAGKIDAILASAYSVTTVTQGDLLSIPYQIYVPNSSGINEYPKTVTLKISSDIDGEFSVSTASLQTGLAHWKIRKYPTGRVYFTISYTYTRLGKSETIEKTHVINVSELEVDIDPITDSLQLALTAQNRSNDETAADRQSWTYKDSKNNLITTKLTGFNWKTNGWVIDNGDLETGDTCLRLTGDARAEINFRPFEADFKQTGKTLELEFAVRDVNNRDAIVIDCLDENNIGFRATPDTVTFRGSNVGVSCRYKEDERIRITITVEDNQSGSQFVSIYLDGILTGVQRYDTTTANFKQTNALNISLGSALCGLDVYAIRVYNKALTTVEVLNNYIADRADPAVKQQLITDNSTLDRKTNELSFEKVKELGQIPIVLFTGKMPTYKGDKRKNVKMTFIDPANPELNFENVLLKEIDVQGTSSAGYVRKNWKIKFNDKITHMPGAIPAKVYCIKVDYAEATGTHNTGTANFVETLYDKTAVRDTSNKITSYTGEGWIPPQKYDTKGNFGGDERARTTIQGFPVVIFERDDENSTPVFSSKGNFNYDKGAEAVFGFTEDYDSFGVECWEFCNNISEAVSFLGPIPDDWKDDFEPRYAPESANFDKIEELLDSKKAATKADGSIDKTMFTDKDQENLSKYQKECIKNFKELHDWVLSTATYKLEGLQTDDDGNISASGSRVPIVPTNDAAAALLPDGDKYKFDEPKTFDSRVYYEYDTEEYRLAKFKNEFEDHFNMHYATMYYLFTSFALMVDQRAKNLFLTRWKDDDGVYRWYPYFYDNDTIFGINNVGALVFDYYHEDIDQIASANVYNGQNSTLWNNFRVCFSNKVAELYASLRNNGQLTYDTLIEQYIAKGSDRWSAAIYNADAEYKYVSMARPDKTGAYDATNLKQVRGPGEHHLKYFIANRLAYCDSKWDAGSYPADQIVVRLYTPNLKAIPDGATEEEIAEIEKFNTRIAASLAAVPASSEITVTPYSDMYVGIKYASGTLQQKRLSKGKAYTFSAPAGSTTNDAETSIYGASALSSLGNLANLYCDYLDLSKATKLIDLQVGHESPDYRNDNIKSVTVGTNRLLKTINVTNCSGLGIAGENPQTTLDLSGCANIEIIKAKGTSLSAVALPKGGYIKTLYLPETINTLDIRNHPYIADFMIGDLSAEDFETGTLTNINQLRIEDCPSLDISKILAGCMKSDGTYSVQYAYLKGFEWSFEDPTFIQNLIPRYKYNENNTKVLIGGILGLAEDGTATDDPAYLDGTCYIAKLTGEEYEEIKKYFPNLTINYGEMTSNVNFNYTEVSSGGVLEERVKQIQITSYNSTAGVCEAPDFIPTYPENAAFTYQFKGWSTEKQIIGTVDEIETLEELRVLEKDWELYKDIDGAALTRITGDRNVYPVFAAIRKNYDIKFVNPTTAAAPIVISVPYGENAGDYYKASYKTPEKLDGASPDLYEFVGWTPSQDISFIKGDKTTFIAQFIIPDKTYAPLGIDDFDTYYDTTTNTNKLGYSLDKNNKTIALTRCTTRSNAGVGIPNKFTVDNVDYTTTSVGGFVDYTNLELISLPDTMQEISSNAFYNCSNLYGVTKLPESLQKIRSQAFFGCKKLKELYIPEKATIEEGAFAACLNLDNIAVHENNSNCELVNVPGVSSNSCLIKREGNNKILMHNAKLKEFRDDAAGVYQKVAVIPTDKGITKIGKHCYHYSTLTSVVIPEGVHTISGDAFSHCHDLKELTFPKSLKLLDATCFAWCYTLQEVELPEGLETISSYVFDKSVIPEIVIPSTVTNIGNMAFGEISTLKTVTFRKATNADGTIKIPAIGVTAFKGSGSSEPDKVPIHFNVPWSREEHIAKFGAEPTFNEKGEYVTDPVFGAVNATLDTHFTFDYEEATGEGDENV